MGSSPIAGSKKPQILRLRIRGFFIVDFSLLNTGEFLNREMNLCEIKTTCYASGAVEGL